jgi:hypothetical protein
MILIYRNDSAIILVQCIIYNFGIDNLYERGKF